MTTSGFGAFSLTYLTVEIEGHDSLARVAPDLATAAARLEQDIDLAYIRENFLRDFDTSLQGLQRVRDIVGNLRDFARLDEAEFKEIDLNAALRSTLEIARYELKKKEIRLETDPPPEGEIESVEDVE